MKKGTPQELEYALFLLEKGRELPASLKHVEARALVEHRRAENRKKFPEVAAAVDMVRKYFPDAELIGFNSSEEAAPTTPE